VIGNRPQYMDRKLTDYWAQELTTRGFLVDERKLLSARALHDRGFELGIFG